jgi:hypothetical protein
MSLSEAEWRDKRRAQALVRLAHRVESVVDAEVRVLGTRQDAWVVVLGMALKSLRDTGYPPHQLAILAAAMATEDTPKN